MYFLDNNSGVNAMPAIAPVNSTSIRWFTEGSGGLPPSWPGMDWFNIVQAELIGVLVAAGMSPEKARVDQLAAAIKSIVGSEALLKKNYLSEIASAGAAAQASARNNLGLGSAATKSVQVDPEDGTSGRVLLTGGFGLGSGGVVITNANNANRTGFYSLVANQHSNSPDTTLSWELLCIRHNNNSAIQLFWQAGVYTTKTHIRSLGPYNAWGPFGSLYGTDNKPAPADINAVNKSGDTMTGQLITPSVATTPEATPWGAGSYAAQLSTQAPFFQPNWQWPVTSGGDYVPIVKGVSTRQGQGYPTAVSFGYLLSGTPSFAQPCIHAKGDNADFNWRFDANNGNFYCPGGVYAAGAIFHVDGNITGNIWGGYLSDWLNNSFLARDNNIGTRATWDYVNQNFIQNVRYSAETQVGASGVNTYHSNTVLTGFDNWDYDYSAETLFWSHIQILKNGQWLTIGR